MKVAIIGPNGFIGRNASRYFPNCILVTKKMKTFEEAENFFEKHPVDWIVHCAAEGGSRLTSDSRDITFNNLMSYYIYARLGIPMIYFSSGAAVWMPETPYGFSKLLIENMDHPHVRIIRIFGCFGPYEKVTRFSAAVSRGFVMIEQDRYFDFFHVDKLLRLVETHMKTSGDKIIDAVEPGPKMKLSDFAKMHGAEYSIEKDGLGPPYVSLT